jgi:hypothetical protein
MLDVAALGAFLAPALPFLIKGAEHAATKASEALSEEALEKAKSLWEKLSWKIGGRPSARAAAERVAEHPDDAEARTSLIAELRALLEAEPQLERELEPLWQEANVIASGERSAALGHGARDNIVITGNDADVDRR